MEKGIVILAMRKASYAQAALNLAISIKYHTPDIDITLLTDGIHLKSFSRDYDSMFNNIVTINEKTVAEAKLNVYKYVNYKRTLYLDADSICVTDVTPLFYRLDKSKFKSNVIDNYTQWTDEKTFEEFFGIKQGLTINSSWFYFEDDKVFKQANEFLNKGFDINKITQNWGGHIPDELFFNASINKLEIDPRVDFNIMFFDERKNIPISSITKEYYFATFYGNKNNSRYDLYSWYDKMMFKICEHFEIEHNFKIHNIMANKLVNEK
jgi:hypothetical protein